MLVLLFFVSLCFISSDSGVLKIFWLHISSFGLGRGAFECALRPLDLPP